jgi:hypothetical protein
MDEQASFARHGAARLRLGLAVLLLAAPVLAGSGQEPTEKKEAAKVAKKMAKAQKTGHETEEEREALRHFQEEVAEYVDLNARLVARLGRPESVAAQKALAHALAASRAKARPGDIFRPEVEPLFRRLIATQLEGPDALDARRTLLEGSVGDERPSVPVVARVNGEYPIGASRATVPPSLLATLPALPACLHYRFVGRDLVLVDSVAGLIVDLLPAAAPDLAAH